MKRSDSTRSLIAPSVLAADFANIEAECRAVAEAGADWLHLDVMDGHFVDNISFGSAICAAIDKLTDLPSDVHLMITRPDHYLARYLPFASSITIHVEAECNIGVTLSRIREAGCGAGISLRPGTSFREIEPYLDQVDLVLIMTVEPGFGGQAFMPEMLQKIQAADAFRKERGFDYHIEVDGGIYPAQAKLCIEAGANVIVSGTGVFGQPDRRAAIAALRGE